MERIVKAFMSGMPAKSGNDSTDGKLYFLYGNPIAQRYVFVGEETGKVMVDYIVTMKGFATRSTCERLNEISRQHGTPDTFHIKNGKPQYNNQEINPYGFINITTIRDTKVSPLA